MTPTLRRILAGTCAAALALALAACGSGSGGSSEQSNVGAPAVKAEKGALPVTIKHKFGETTITKAPQRVVVVGLTEQDALLALGVDPVATSDWFGKAPGNIFPWAEKALGGDKLPVTLDPTDGIPVEKVAALRPDLIIGVYSGMTQKEYDLLSKIAPTVAQPADYVDYGTPWDETTMIVGKAIGRPKAAKALVDSVAARIEAAKNAHPEFAGKQAVVATNYEGIYVYGPEDPRARLLTQLGFSFPPALKDVGNDKEFGGSISGEQVSKVNVDVTVWVATPKQVADTTGGGWAKTSGAKEGRGFYIDEDNGAFYVAHSMLTPLSIPYVLDRYVPQLAAAVDGNPATKVPSPKN